MLGWTLSASRKGSVSPELNLGAQLLPQSQKVVLCIFVLCEKEGWNHPTLKGDNTITDTSWWAERRGLWKKHNLPHHCTAGLPCAFFFFLMKKANCISIPFVPIQDKHCYHNESQGKHCGFLLLLLDFLLICDCGHWVTGQWACHITRITVVRAN